MTKQRSAVCYTGPCIYLGDKKVGGSSAFDLGAVVDPLHNADDGVAIERAPIMCIRCAGYMSCYSRMGSAIDGWICSLCGSLNPSFVNSRVIDASQIKHSTPELAQPNYAFGEEVPRHTVCNTGGAVFAPALASNVLVRSKLALAIDRDLCGDVSALQMVSEGIANLPDTCEVTITVFDNHLRLLRLGDGVLTSSDPLCADILPGSADYSSLLAHQMRRNLYSTKAAALKANLAVLRQGLMAFYAPPASSTSTLENRVGCRLEALVGSALAEGDTSHLQGLSGSADRPTTRLVLLTSRTVHCGGHNRGTSTVGGAPQAAADRLAPYNALGLAASRENCSIDVFYASMRAGNLDCLDALVAPSGGSVIAGSSYDDDHVRESFMQLLTRSTQPSTLYDAVLPTLEIRTCGRLVVDRIVGPIASAADTLKHNRRQSAGNNGAGASTSGSGGDGRLTSAEAEFALDDAHLSQSLYYLRDYANPSTKQEDFHAQLVQRNCESVVLCGAVVRGGSSLLGSAGTQDAITVQFKLAEDGDPRSPASPFARRSLAIGNSDASPTSGDGRGNSSSVAYVQMVVRYYTRSQVNTSMLRKVTKVCTQEVQLTPSKEEYVRTVDPELWAHVVSRGIVADYHTHCVETFGGAARNRLDEQGVNGLASLKAATVAAVDALAKSVAEEWPLNLITRPKVVTACRALYGLREGPLLDGPAADHMESYMLRAAYLRATAAHALRLLQPSLALCPFHTAHPATSIESTKIAPAAAVTSVDPSSASGDALVARYPPPPSIGTSSSAPSSAQTTSATAPLHVLYPPPPSASASGGAADLTMRFPPPPVPPPPSQLPGSTAAAVPSQTHVVPGSAESEIDLLVTVPADSIWLLPGTIAVLDCGDRIVVRQNAHRKSATDDDDNSGTTASSSSQLESVGQKMRTVARSRFPVPAVYVLPRPGTPQDRMLQCRLAPAHLDAPASILAALRDGPPALSAPGSAGAVTAAERAMRTLCATVTAEEVEGLVAAAPFTDQHFFAKYLHTLVPGLATRLLSSAAGAQDALSSQVPGGVPPSQQMDRGPISVFQPPSSSKGGAGVAYGGVDGVLQI